MISTLYAQRHVFIMRSKGPGGATPRQENRLWGPTNIACEVLKTLRKVLLLRWLLHDIVSQSFIVITASPHEKTNVSAPTTDKSLRASLPFPNAPDSFNVLQYAHFQNTISGC